MHFRLIKVKSSPGYCLRKISSYCKSKNPSRISKIVKKKELRIYLCKKLDTLMISRSKIRINCDALAMKYNLLNIFGKSLVLVQGHSLFGLILSFAK